MFVGQYQPLLHLWYPQLPKALRQVIPRFAVQPEADVLPVLLQLHVSVLARRVGHLFHAIVGHGVLIPEEDVLHAVLPEAGDVGGDGGAGGGALNKHRTPRGEILSGVGGLYAADHGADAAFRDPRKVQLLDGDPAGKEALDHHAAGQGFGGILLCRGLDVIIVVVLVLLRLGRGGGGVVVAHPLHHGAVGAVAGQASSRYLVVGVRKGLRGHFAVRSTDGRDLGVQYLAPRLGRHLGVAADVEFSRVRVVGVVRRAVCAVADTCRAASAHGLDCAAPDGDVAAGTLLSAADACAAAVAALSGKGAVLALVVLDGQGALRLVAVLLEARIVAAALQLVFAVQLDGRIVVALHGDGGFARIDWAVTAAIPLLLAADVDLQVVEGDVHVAAGGVDGDGMLLRLAGDDGVALIFYEVVIALLDVVRPLGVARLHGDVAVGDVPCSRIGRDAGAYHDACDDGGGYAPPECAFQSHSMSSSGLFVIREPVFLDANLPKNQEDVNKTCANGGVFGVSDTKGAKPLRHRLRDATARFCVFCSWAASPLSNLSVIASQCHLSL